jgi:gamma-glutamylcyclotransferase
MTTLLYFAYGSNMLTSRLQARCPSARGGRVATADNHSLSFFKRGRDGSGKGTLVPDTRVGQRVVGVVFELDERELSQLDHFEGAGAGYDRVQRFRVRTETGSGGLDAFTYIAGEGYLDPGLKPFDWYLSLVVAGAREYALPEDYVAVIARTPTVADPLEDRPSRLEALALLGTSS